MMQDDWRFNGVAAMLGGTGTGKTDFVKGNPEHGGKGIVRFYLQKGMRVIIYNDIDHPKYRDLYTVRDLSQLAHFKSGIIRIIHSDFEAVLAALNKYVWNCLVVWEDAYKYVPDRWSKDMVGMVLDAKQRNLDFLFMYHSWAWLCRDLARRVDAFILCKVPDFPATKFTKNEMPYLDDITAMQKAVNSSNNRFAKDIFLTRING